MTALRLVETSPDALSPLLSALPSLPRAMLARLTERMIERLDELDGTDGEDDFSPQACNTGEYSMPGCPISDPGGGAFI